MESGDLPGYSVHLDTDSQLNVAVTELLNSGVASFVMQRETGGSQLLRDILQLYTLLKKIVNG